MKSLTSSDEQRLMDGVKLAVDLVDSQGLTPNAALQKVAEQFQYTPGFLKSACSAFNTGRQLAQWKANQHVLDKLASFPLADYEAVHSALWGDQAEKSAQLLPHVTPVLADYGDQDRQQLLQYALSSQTKCAAEESPRDFDELRAIQVQRAFDAQDFRQREFEEARREKQAAEDLLNLRLHLLTGYFRKFAYDRLPFAQVEFAATERFGSVGRALMDYVAERFPGEKRAADQKYNWAGFQASVNYDAEPYTLIAAAIKQAGALNAATQNLAQAEVTLKQATESVLSFTRPLQLSSTGTTGELTPYLIDVAGEKHAAGYSPFSYARQLGEKIQAPHYDRLEDKIRDLDDPQHINELRKIRAQTVLTQLMSDPDNPISGYEPEEVLAEYNKMVQLSPRLADQPAIVEPLLRKRLAGNVEPFEVGETLKLEKGLQDTQSTPAYSPSEAKPKTAPKTTDVMKHATSLIG